ncbi:hypothetical protein Q3G72_020886 [Acer saccharum]|nr:hypothetical protein Q3G72_020886 [Acer saccharum]
MCGGGLRRRPRGRRRRWSATARADRGGAGDGGQYGGHGGESTDGGGGCPRCRSTGGVTIDGRWGWSDVRRPIGQRWGPVTGRSASGVVVRRPAGQVRRSDAASDLLNGRRLIWLNL